MNECSSLSFSRTIFVSSSAGEKVFLVLVHPVPHDTFTIQYMYCTEIKHSCSRNCRVTREARSNFTNEHHAIRNDPGEMPSHGEQRPVTLHAKMSAIKSRPNSNVLGEYIATVELMFPRFAFVLQNRVA